MDPLFPLTNLWKDFGLFQARCSSVLVSLLPNGTEAKKNSPRQWFRRNRHIILVALFHPEECPVVLYRTSHTGSQAGKGTDRLLLKHPETEKQPIRKTARHIGSKPRYSTCIPQRRRLLLCNRNITPTALQEPGYSWTRSDGTEQDCKNRIDSLEKLFEGKKKQTTASRTRTYKEVTNFTLEQQLEN